MRFCLNQLNKVSSYEFKGFKWNECCHICCELHFQFILASWLCSNVQERNAKCSLWTFLCYYVDVSRSQPVRLCNLCHVLFLPSFQSDGFLKDNNNAAQRLLDGVKYISQSVSELSVKPAKAVTSWLTDQIAPTYWKPNSLILVHDYNWTKIRTKKNFATTLV